MHQAFSLSSPHTPPSRQETQQCADCAVRARFAIHGPSLTHLLFLPWYADCGGWERARLCPIPSVCLFFAFLCFGQFYTASHHLVDHLFAFFSSPAGGGKALTVWRCRGLGFIWGCVQTWWGLAATTTTTTSSSHFWGMKSKCFVDVGLCGV